MNEMIFDDLRRIVLGLLFVVAFGWMAAQVVPGGDGAMSQQVAASGEVIPPRP
jgi:hypothetical protein